MKEKLIKWIDRIIYVLLCLYAITLCFDVTIYFMKIAFYISLIRLVIKRPNVEMKTSYKWALGIFVLTLLPSIFFNEVSRNYSFGLSEYRSQFISPMVGLFVLWIVDFGKGKLYTLLSLCAASLLVNDILVMHQFYNGVNRAIGMSSLMFFPGAILILVPFLLVWGTDRMLEPNKYKRGFFLLTFCCTIPAACFNGTRIMWIGLAITIPILLYCLIENKKTIVLLLFIMLLASTTLFYNSTLLQQRLDTLTDKHFQSNTERLLMWNSAWNMFENHWLVGVGIGNYPNQYESIYRSTEAKEHQDHPHNVFLKILAETGIIGGAGYIWFNMVLLYDVFLEWKRDRNRLALAFFFGMIGFLIQGLTDCNFGGPWLKGLNEFFWFMTAFYMVLNRRIIFKQNG